MLGKIVLSLALMLSTFVTSAQTIEVNPDHPGQYTVQKGDTLWDISGKFLVEPWRWPEIWQVNPQIENPHLIYPGDIISLSYDGSTPVLSMRRGQAGRLVKLGPEVRQGTREQAIPTIPLDVIRQFLTRPLIVEEDEMKGWPYVVSNYEQHLVASPGVDIYARGLSNDGVEKYSIYRQGPAYISRRNGDEDILGYEAIHVADAELTRGGDPATLRISGAIMEVKEGDRLIPQTEEEIYSSFIPTTPDESIEASIVSAQNVLSEIGQYQVVVLDRGSRDGVSIGNVFGVFQDGKVIMDKIAGEEKKYNTGGLIEYLGKSPKKGEMVELPEVRSGVLMVFRTFDRVSYALVMEALRPVHINDSVRGL